MAQRRSLGWAELKVGLLVILGFAVLAYAVIRVGGPTSFFAEKFKLTAYFPSANGLRPGNDVLLDGLLVGTVSEVGLNRDPNIRGRVAVVIEIDAKYKENIRQDSLISIETVGLLGDMTVQITSGTVATDMVGDGGKLFGADTGDVKRVIQGANDVVYNFKILSDKLNTISQNVVEISDQVKGGRGSLGKFLTDPELHDNLNGTVIEMQKLITDMRTGPGTAGKLISDDEMYLRMTGLLSQMETLVTKFESGNGTAGKFLNDPRLFDSLASSVDKLDSMVGRIDRGEGSFGKLMRDDAFYQNLQATLNQMNNLLVAIQSGDGTAGKLIKDPTLFNHMDQVMSEVQKLVYDIRQDPKKYLTIRFSFF
jgi:phospholipid/cholesterol/gamma-HCH transport system substrate-binding protein